MIPRLTFLHKAKAPGICVLLFVAVVLTFLPAVRNSFINFDDPVYVTANPNVQGGLTWHGIRWAFTTLDQGSWHPLTWLSIMLDCSLFGARPGGHHLTSVLLHAASSALLFLALRRMTESTWRSAFVAAMFGLHPLRVESVVWAAERKDVLSAFFFMLTLWAYAKYVSRVESPKARVEDRGSNAGRPESTVQIPPSGVHSPQPEVQSGTSNPDSKSGPRRLEVQSHVPETAYVVSDPTPDGVSCAWWYIAALGCFALGLMSKPMLVTVPAVLLLLDWWPLGRLAGSGQPAGKLLLVEKLPFLGLAFIVGAITIFGQQRLGAMPLMREVPVTHRLTHAICAYAGYLAQMLWPANLSVYYTFPKAFPGWALAGAVVVSGGILVAVLYGMRTRPYLAFGWFWYSVMLLPVSGLIQAGNQAHADRYTYLPLIGVFTMVAWGALDWSRRLRFQKEALLMGAVAVVSACALLTRHQIGYWKDSRTLFRHALAVDPHNGMAHFALGTALRGEGRTDDAMVEFRLAIGDAPGFMPARLNLGVMLGSQGRMDEAIEELGAAVRLAPNDLDARFNLGVALMNRKRYEEALTQFREALRIRPGYERAKKNVQVVLAAKAATSSAKSAKK